MEWSVVPHYLNSIFILQSLSHSMCTFWWMVYGILFELHCILICIDCGYFSCIKFYPPKHFKSVSKNTYNKPHLKSLIFQQKL